jgi:Uma2 family endonuclease
MTERQFLDWRPEELRAEWVDGEVILVAPANDGHDSLEIWLTAILKLFLDESELGELRSDMFVRFAQRHRLRVPDLMVIANDHRDRIRQTIIEGPPDVIFEIISPDSRNRDRRAKYLEYEAVGVREYWIIDPLVQRVDCYVLHGKAYQQTNEIKGWLPSVVLSGFSLRPDWLWPRPLPKVSRVLKQMRRRQRA